MQEQPGIALRYHQASLDGKWPPRRRPRRWGQASGTAQSAIGAYLDVAEPAADAVPVDHRTVGPGRTNSLDTWLGSLGAPS